jgi:predicted Zn-dependent peptidase
MSSDWQKGLEIVLDLICHPAFNEANIEEVRAEQLASLKLQDEQLTEKTFRLLRQGLYQDHPYHLDALGKTEVVANATREQIVNFHQTFFRPEFMTIVVSGNIIPDEVAKYLDELLVDWKPAGVGELVKTPPPPPVIEGGPLKLTETIQSAQTHLGLSFLAPGLGHPDQAPLEVLDSYLSGMGGPLFNELRNKQSLAYAVMSSYGAGLNVGAFMFYIATDPQKTEQALVGLNTLIEQVRTEKLTNEAVSQAIKYLTGQQKINFQTLGKQSEEALYNSLYGLGLDYKEKHLNQIKAVTAEDIFRVAQKYLDPKQSVLAIVGTPATDLQATTTDQEK